MPAENPGRQGIDGSLIGAGVAVCIRPGARASFLPASSCLLAEPDTRCQTAQITGNVARSRMQESSICRLEQEMTAGPS